MNESKELQSIIDDLAQKAYDTWGGKIGEERAASVKKVIETFLPNWSEKLGLSQLEILKSIEKNRRVNSVNHYQEIKFPKLDEVTIFETVFDFKAMHKNLGFRCPSCDQVSTDPRECNHNPVECNWKSYGLFGCLNKGYRFVVKELFLEDGTLYEIFAPVALEPAND